MQTIAERLWNSSPASLSRALQRRVRNRRAKPGWFPVQAGPLAGLQLLLPNNIEGAWLEMVQGTFDHFLYAALAERCNLRGKTCWDIGAHIGYHTLGFAALGARVVAFEPNRQNADRLHLHLERNPSVAPRIRHLGVAVSDRDGEMEFLQDADINNGSSGSHLVEATAPLPDRVYAHFERLTVPTVRMDTLLERGEPPPDVIKIDIEGAEYLALQGGRRLLGEHKPILLMEVHHIRLMFHIQRFLLELGYTTHLLDEEHDSPSRCFVLGAAQ